MRADIYLTFDGKCAQAFDFYRSIFGGTFTSKMKVSESPCVNDVPKEYHGLIMHMSLKVGGNLDLMGSDRLPMCTSEFKVGTNTKITLSPDTKEEADRLFQELSSNGGSVDMPLQDMFWGSYHGTVTDSFGIKWIIDCTTSPEAKKCMVHATVSDIKSQVLRLEDMLREAEEEKKTVV